MSINFSDGTPSPTGSATDAALVDPSRVAVQLLLNELRGAAFVWPLARDLSSQIFDGSLTVVIPRAKGYSVGDAPGAPTGANVDAAFNNAFGNTARTFNRDTLVVDRFKSVHDYIYDLDQDRSRIDLRGNFLQEAPASLAEFLEADITESLYIGKSSAQTTAGSFVTGDLGTATINNFVQFSGSEGSTANAVVEVSQLDDIAIRMSQLKIPKSDRIFLASPKQARLLAANSSIRDASQYGTNESILNGEVARISGFRIVESPFLAPSKAVAFHRDAIYRAILEDAAVESSRLHEILADLLTITVKYGFQTIRDGGLVFPMASEASLLLAAQAGILADEANSVAGVPGNTANPNDSLGSSLS